MRSTEFGSPSPKVRSATTVLIIEPTAGFAVNQPATDLQLGQSPSCANFMMRDGSLRPRPVLSQHTLTSNPMGVLVTGGAEIQSSVGSRFNLVSGTTRLAYYSAASYSPLSQVSVAGIGSWSATTYDRTDITQIYEPVNDENLAIVSTTSSYNTLLCWKAGATTFSVVTQAPRARWVAALDNFVIAANIRDPGSAQSKFVQRVQWSDRGNPFSWTPGGNSLAGNQDLLDANGGIQRLIAQETRIVIFFEDEIWSGQRGTFPNTFNFSPLDRSVGTPYGKTCADTPRGIIFLGRDFQVYLLPKEGGTAQPIGDAVRPYLRDNIGTPETAWATYDTLNGQYALYHALRATGNLPQRALWLNVQTGAWAPQRWDVSTSRNLTAGWQGLLATGTGGVSWSALSTIGTTWLTQLGTWATLTPTSAFGQQTTYIGSSDGTVWYLNSSGTVDDGTPRTSKWRSGAFGGDEPEHQKVVNAFRMDYTADSASTLTVRFSRDQGATFDPDITLPLPAATQESMVPAFPYTLARYPMFEVQTDDSFLDLLRFWVPVRRGGR